MSTDSPEPVVRRRRRTGRGITTSQRWATLGVIVAVVVSLDQFTKWWALNNLDPATGGESIALFWTLRLNLAFNTGMAFSRGAESGRWIGLIALIICAVLVLVARKVQSKLQLVLVAIVIGGALGNVVDRAARADQGLMTGAVVDFIDVQWYPIFNLADACIVVGGIALALVGLGSGDRRKAEDDTGPDPAGNDAAGNDPAGNDPAGKDAAGKGDGSDGPPPSDALDEPNRSVEADG